MRTLTDQEEQAPFRPHRVRLAKRHDPEGKPTGAKEVWYAGFYVGMAVPIGDEWVAVPKGTRTLADWGGLNRHPRSIDAIEELAAIGCARVSSGEEPTGR